MLAEHPTLKAISGIVTAQRCGIICYLIMYTCRKFDQIKSTCSNYDNNLINHHDKHAFDMKRQVRESQGEENFKAREQLKYKLSRVNGNVQMWCYITTLKFFNFQNEKSRSVTHYNFSNLLEYKHKLFQSPHPPILLSNKLRQILSLHTMPASRNSPI